MLKEERHRHILDLLQRDGKVLAADLAARLGMSEDTARRDLSELDSAGVLQRVHGGALPRPPSIPYMLRDNEGDTVKRAMAEVAAGLVRDGQVIVMDSGTTVLAVARCLPATLRATVITNSVPLAAVLSHHPTVEVRVVGGTLNKAAQALLGVPAVEALGWVHADLCLLGVCSLHPEVGISVPDIEEAYVKRAMVLHSTAVVAVAGAEKLGTAERYVVAPLHGLTHLITARTMTEAALAPYREAGVTVLEV